MREINLFVEDAAHDAFLRALIHRFAVQHKIAVEVAGRSVRHGHGRVINELEEYVRDLKQSRPGLPDVLVVAIDANCSSLATRRREVEKAAADFKDLLICAIPDPHIERWLLIDSSAFKAVLGRGCSAPGHKCDKDLYKDLLARAVKAAGVEPIFGGIEHTEDIVNAMDLEMMEQSDQSLGELLRGFRHKFREWGGT